MGWFKRSVKEVEVPAPRPTLKYTEPPERVREFEHMAMWSTEGKCLEPGCDHNAFWHLDERQHRQHTRTGDMSEGPTHYWQGPTWREHRTQQEIDAAGGLVEYWQERAQQAEAELLELLPPQEALKDVCKNCGKSVVKPVGQAMYIWSHSDGTSSCGKIGTAPYADPTNHKKR